MRRGHWRYSGRGLPACARGGSCFGIRKRHWHQQRGGRRGCGGDWELFVEAIIAPSFTPEAVARFAAKKNLRLLEIASSGPEAGKPVRMLKQVSGGFLMQDADRHSIAEADLRVVTARTPTPEEMRALLFAWSVCKHVKSNAIVYARFNGGFGQTRSE